MVIIQFITTNNEQKNLKIQGSFTPMSCCVSLIIEKTIIPNNQNLSLNRNILIINTL